jgi:hypothetical protein
LLRKISDDFLELILLSLLFMARPPNFCCEFNPLLLKITTILMLVSVNIL